MGKNLFKPAVAIPNLIYCHSVQAKTWGLVYKVNKHKLITEIFSNQASKYKPSGEPELSLC